jgi:hypothetical protein
MMCQYLDPVSVVNPSAYRLCGLRATVGMGLSLGIGADAAVRLGANAPNEVV